ncbi:hypothetical protein CAI21_20490 [Alkalilimnicola ehrlichii]|uniref:DUF1190 domain-containing protein n=1 Tax=Alkalilimnicola ehrlichii TaxID=351052 RepID=A0A3E0WU01_9GAMM|nr:DUF1190 domain-containing protein [Alkalilimnicola ehrlichii]RFA24731.1 hypothetical protein CAI21_20490 [Alkalilimnicola ehrlichii]RFA35437.1 hypothetical protein CAL65_13250 [Alkalilimnicola ehrlichii]
MKRSKFAGLALMGAAPFFLLACDSQPQQRSLASTATAYQSVQACIDAGIYTPRACEDGFDAARRQLPRYGSQEHCEQQFERCDQVGGGSIFVPAMTGFMVGHMIGSSGRQTAYHQPIYYDRATRGDWDRAVSSARARMPQHTVDSNNRQQPRATTNSRSGFGSGAAARGGWGS